MDILDKMIRVTMQGLCLIKQCIDLFTSQVVVNKINCPWFLSPYHLLSKNIVFILLH